MPTSLPEAGAELNTLDDEDPLAKETDAAVDDHDRGRQDASSSSSLMRHNPLRSQQILLLLALQKASLLSFEDRKNFKPWSQGRLSSPHQRFSTQN
jgi:hypothetical protein